MACGNPQWCPSFLRSNMKPRKYKCSKCGNIWFATEIIPQSVHDEEEMEKADLWTHGKDPLTSKSCGGTWELQLDPIDPGAEL